MKELNLVELLATHAESLNGGQDETERMIALYRGVLPELPALLRLARRLKEVLVPVVPPATFTAGLKTQLLGGMPAQASAAGFLPRPLLLLLALLGSALSLAGLVLFFLRRGRLAGPRAQSAAGLW